MDGPHHFPILYFFATSSLYSKCFLRFSSYCLVLFFELLPSSAEKCYFLASFPLMFLCYMLSLVIQHICLVLNLRRLLPVLSGRFLEYFPSLPFHIVSFGLMCFCFCFCFHFDIQRRKCKIKNYYKDSCNI